MRADFGMLKRRNNWGVVAGGRQEDEKDEEEKLERLRKV